MFVFLISLLISIIIIVYIAVDARDYGKSSWG